jgi:hypothetical protein
MNRKFIALLALFLGFLACTQPPVPMTETPVVVSTETQMPTETEMPTLTVTTPVATATSTVTKTLVPTTPTVTTIPPIVETAMPKYKINLIHNPYFTGGFSSHFWPEINVVEGHQPFYLDYPYSPNGPVDAPMLCEDGQTEHCNPQGLKQRRPEYKECQGVDFLIGGCQQWFCFFGTCEAGLFFDIMTERGKSYNFGAIVRQWYNKDNDIESDIETDDDKICCFWSLGVGKEGDEKSFSEDTYWSPAIFTEFDKWVLIEWQFIANGDTTRLFVRNTRNWPVGNNDNYITFAFAYELDEITPTQISGTPPITGAIFVFPSTYTPFVDQLIYTEPDLNSPILSMIDRDYTYVVQWLVEVDDQTWLYLPNVRGYALLQGEFNRLD